MIAAIKRVCIHYQKLLHLRTVSKMASGSEAVLAPLRHAVKEQVRYICVWVCVTPHLACCRVLLFVNLKKEEVPRVK